MGEAMLPAVEGSIVQVDPPLKRDICCRARPNASLSG